MSETLGASVKLGFDGKEVTAGFQNLAAQLDQLNANVEKSSVSMSKLAAGNLIAKGLSAAFNAVKSSLGGAISRIDTLNNYSRMMESLGFSANEAASSQEKLSKSIEGLPTTLDDIVGNTQMLVASVGDLGKATDMAVALNDMFTASGQGAEAASRALVQYNQMIARNKVDMQSWMSVVQTAPAQVKALAVELLGAEANQSDLYNALQNGELAISDLNDAIIKLDTKGGAGMASFHDQALSATDGIQTGIKNLRTAVTKGVAKVIESFNKAAKANGLPTIAETLEMLKGVVNTVFSTISKVVGKVVSVTAPVFKFVTKNIGVIGPMITSLVGTIGTLVIIKKVTNWMSGVKQGIIEATASLASFLVGQNASTAAIVANTTAETANAAASAVNTTAKTAETVATTSLTGAVKMLNAAILASPLGIVAALTAGLIGLGKVIDNLSGASAAIKAAKEAEENARETKESVKSTAESFVETQKTWDSATRSAEKIQAYETAIADIDDQMKDVKWQVRGQEKDWKDIDESLTHIAGLSENYQNIVLSNTPKTKPQGTEVGQAYLEGMWADAELRNARDWLNIKLEQKKQERLREMWADAEERNARDWQDRTINGEERLNRTLSAIYDSREHRLKQSIKHQTALYSELTEANQETIDSLRDMWEGYYEASSLTSEKLDLNFELTAQQMAENLGYNREVVTNFKNNMNTLRAWADTLNPVDPIQSQMKDGFDLMLADMAQAGIDAAPEAQALYNAIAGGDMTALQNISIAYGAAGELAGEATVAGMDKSAKSIAEQTKYLWGSIPKSVNDVLKETNWSELSEDMAEDTLKGWVQTIEDRSDGAVKLLEYFGLDSIDALKEALGVASPSWKTAEAARYSVEGFVNEVNNSKNNVARVMQGMGTTAVTALSWLPGSMYNAGANAAQGFVNGLNAVSGSVMRTAQTIASTVSNTISSALQIHSPSDVTFRFGEFVGKGLAYGIAKMQAVVEAASQRLSDAAARVFAPTTEYSYSFAGAGGGSIQMPIQIDESDPGDRAVTVEGAVYLDGVKVGTLVAPHSRKAIAEIDTFENYRRGIR